MQSLSDLTSPLHFTEVPEKERGDSMVGLSHQRYLNTTCLVEEGEWVGSRHNEQLSWIVLRVRSCDWSTAKQGADDYSGSQAPGAEAWR